MRERRSEAKADLRGQNFENIQQFFGIIKLNAREWERGQPHRLMASQNEVWPQRMRVASQNEAVLTGSGRPHRRRPILQSEAGLT